MAQEKGLFKTEYGTSLNAGLPRAANARGFQWVFSPQAQVTQRRIL
jgi:hypothetical protein